jgi:hypothetical protein
MRTLQIVAKLVTVWVTSPQFHEPKYQLTIKLKERWVFIPCFVFSTDQITWFIQQLMFQGAVWISWRQQTYCIISTNQ